MLCLLWNAFLYRGLIDDVLTQALALLAQLCSKKKSSYSLSTGGLNVVSVICESTTPSLLSLLEG